MEKKIKRLKLCCIILAVLFVISNLSLYIYFYEVNEKLNLLSSLVRSNARNATECFEEYYKTGDETSYNGGITYFRSMTDEIRYMHEITHDDHESCTDCMVFIWCANLITYYPETTALVKEDLFDLLSEAVKYDKSDGCYDNLSLIAINLNNHFQNHLKDN